jgi:hypothetical protein
MKTSIIICGLVISLASCHTSVKLQIPAAFTDQATEMKVSGARSKTMSFGNYKTSKIKRGWHTKGGRGGRGFFWENLVLNRFGIQKNEVISKEKDKFQYTINDGTRTAEVFSRESEVKKNLNYKIGNGGGFFEKVSQLQYYQYFFSTTIFTGDSAHQQWDMILTNTYDRKEDPDNRLFTLIRNTNSGVATNGIDSIFIRPLNLRKTEAPNGKQGKFPIDMLAGYELVIDGGVAAVLDNIGKSVWIYKELDNDTRLIVAAISTSILAKRIKDVKW